MIKGIFFDLYDTLIIAGEIAASVWLGELYTCLKNYGLSIPVEQFAVKCNGFFSRREPGSGNEGLTVYERRISDLCLDLGVKIDVNGLHDIADHTVETTNRNCHLDENCHDVLKSLQSRYTLALISNFDHPPYIRTMLLKTGLHKYFSAVIISGEVGLKKPDPAIFQLALHKTGMEPEEVIHVGDSLKDDMSGAVAAGIKPVLILRKPAPDNLSKVFRDDFVNTPGVPAGITTIRSLPELLKILAALG